MSNSFYDIGQKFEMSPDRITLVNVIPGVVGTIPNLYVFEFENDTSGTPWNVYEDDFCLLVTQGFWTPIGCDIDSLLKKDFDGPNECDHDWKEYYGLSDKYEFCTKCDKKKDLI